MDIGKRITELRNAKGLSVNRLANLAGISQSFVQLTCTRVAVIHGGNKTGCIVHGDPLITGHINATAEVQSGVQHSQGLIFCHIDLIEDTESALYGCKKDGSFPENDTVPVICIRPDQIGRVRSDVERDVPDRPQESCSEILGQDIFSGRLRTARCSKRHWRFSLTLAPSRVRIPLRNVQIKNRSQ